MMRQLKWYRKIGAQEGRVLDQRAMLEEQQMPDAR
jgi:hypothetical protein